MATENIELNVNPIDWTTANMSTVHTADQIYYYENHPDYEGIVYVIGNGSTTLANLPIYANTWQGGTYLTTGRVFSGETLKTGLSGDTWRIVAEIADDVTAQGNASFLCMITGNSNRRESFIVDVAFNNEATLRTHQNTSISIRNASGATTKLLYLLGARLGVAADGSAGGANLQIYVDDSAGFRLQTTLIHNAAMDNNDANYFHEGWQIVSATSTDNDKTPSGATASFLVAGEESGTSSSSFSIIGEIGVYAVSATSARIDIPWREIPYQIATTFGITYTTLQLRSSTAAVYTFTGVETPGAPTLLKEKVSVLISGLSGLTTGTSYFFGATSFKATLS